MALTAKDIDGWHERARQWQDDPWAAPSEYFFLMALEHHFGERQPWLHRKLPSWRSEYWRRTEQPDPDQLLSIGTLIHGSWFGPSRHRRMVIGIRKGRVCRCVSSTPYIQAASCCRFAHLHEPADLFDVWGITMASEDAHPRDGQFTQGQVDGWLNNMIAHSGRLVGVTYGAYPYDCAANEHYVEIVGQASVAIQGRLF